MIFTFAEEDVSEYVYRFPKDECIFDVSIKRNNSWEEAIEQTATLLKEKCALFKNGILYLWLRSESRRNLSKSERLKGIWNNEKLKWLSKEQCRLFSHSDGVGEFCSALAKIEESQLMPCLDFVRTNGAAFLFFTAEKMQPDALDSYLCEHGADLEKTVSFFFEKNMIFLRVSGNFDDRELCVDFFGRRELLANMFPQGTLNAADICGCDSQI